METKRIHNLTEQEHTIQRTCFMHNVNCFSKRSSFDPKPEDLFGQFSSSKAIQVEEQEYSKRQLVIDRNLAVPFKKRKQLLEESHLCDVSSDEDLQKSDNNGGINVTFCPKFEKENVHESTPSTSEKAHKEGKIEFNLQSSVLVKADDSTEWTRLKCFESVALDGSDSATFFSGGPIQCSAFSITPPDMKVHQYVAVAVGNNIYNNLSYNNTKNMSGLIQLWNVGSLHERKILNQRPSMELALYHNNGIITEMKWCPADCYDKCPSTCNLPRLGLLAASSSDSYVYIYSVPQPDFMPKLKPTFPIYFTQPSMKLAPLFDGPCNATDKAVATCIEWEKNGERIVAGYGNGTVCMWLIKGSSFTSHIAEKSTDQLYITRPYLLFQPTGAPITSLSFAPFSNLRWLLVLSIDKVVRCFDLLDTSAPFMVGKQGYENSCFWGKAFCGVYSSPALNHLGHVSLSAKECCAEEQKGGSGLFDSSTHVAVSENMNFHAIADMAGTVTVNFLKNFCKPLETSYLTYMLFETEILALDKVNLPLETSQSKINISGNIPSNEITSVSDMKGSFNTEIKQGSLSSSSVFSSPKHGKTIVIETTQCFEEDAVNLLKSSPESSTLSDFKDDNNRIKGFLNKSLNSDDETNAKMIKYSEFSEDLMRDLLMAKISSQSKSSPDILPLHNSNNSADCNFKGAKHLSDGALITSPANSDYTGDTVIYPLEDYFCDTSHSNALKSIESNAQSEKLKLNKERNTLHQTTVHRMNGNTLETEVFSENSLKICAEVTSENSNPNENSSSKNWFEPNTENCNLNNERNLMKSDYFGYDHDSFQSNDYHLISKHSDIHREEYCSSKKSPKEIMKNGKKKFQNLDTNGNIIYGKDATSLSLHKNCDVPLCDVLRSNNLNQSMPLPSMCSSTTSNDPIICDKDEQQLPVRVIYRSPTASDYSGDTIMYSPESYDYNKTVSYSKSKKPGAISQKLCINKQENTFQDTLLHKMDEVVLHGSKTKLFTENCFSFCKVNCEHFPAKESLKCNPEYETDSDTKSCNSSDENRSFDRKDILPTDFHLLQSEYSCDKSEGKHSVLTELPQNDKEPQKLSYGNLIASFGVIYKNNLVQSTNPLKRQENGIYVKYNPLSVIKTMSWNPNEGCQSWLFVGGNSGIGRLVSVPDYLADIKKKPEPKHKKT